MRPTISLSLKSTEDHVSEPEKTEDHLGMSGFLRRCLIHSTTTLNLFLSFSGVGLIVYSLWLLKIWKQVVADLVSPPSLLKPWFIYTSLALGIIVCFNMIISHMVTNHMSYTAFYIYILFVCPICFLEMATIIAVFIKINWKAKICKYIDLQHKQIGNFLIFQVALCYSIAIVILIAQINAVILAIILWIIEPEEIGRRRRRNVSEVNQYSFLVRPNSPVSGDDLRPNGRDF